MCFQGSFGFKCTSIFAVGTRVLCFILMGIPMIIQVFLVSKLFTTGFTLKGMGTVENFSVLDQCGYCRELVLAVFHWTAKCESTVLLLNMFVQTSQGRKLLVIYDTLNWLGFGTCWH